MSAFWNNAFIILGGIASVLIVLEFFGAKEWLAKLKPLSKVRVFLLLAALVVLAIGIYGKVAAASVTFGNIEDKVRVWLDDVKLQPYKVDDINAFFHFETKEVMGNKPIRFLRPKNDDHFIVILAPLRLSDEDKTAFNKLPNSERTNLILKLRAAMSQAKYKYVFQSDEKELILSVYKRVPITSDLTQLAFYDAVDEVAAGSALINDTIELELGSSKRLDKEVTQPSPTPDKGASQP